MLNTPAQKKSALQTVLENFGNDRGEPVELSDYSGRGMYGKYCLAVTGLELRDLLRAVALFAGDVDSERLADDIDHLRQDSMGRGSVFYFPGVDYISDTPSGYENEEEE